MSDNELQSAWQEFKVLVESIEKDIVKNSSGNKSAGVRARKGLRSVKKVAADLVKLSLATDSD